MKTKVATDVRPGDRVLLPSGRELLVTRVERNFLDRTDVLCLVGETSEGWFAQGIRLGVELTVLNS